MWFERLCLMLNWWIDCSWWFLASTRLKCSSVCCFSGGWSMFFSTARAVCRLMPSTRSAFVWNPSYVDQTSDYGRHFHHGINKDFLSHNYDFSQNCKFTSRDSFFLRILSFMFWNSDFFLWISSLHFTLNFFLVFAMKF